MTPGRSRVAKFIFDNSLLLLAGTAAAVSWANLHPASYDNVAHPLHFAVNDVGMVFFVALAVPDRRVHSLAASCLSPSPGVGAFRLSRHARTPQASIMTPAASHA